jgi:hypothetical protein
MVPGDHAADTGLPGPYGGVHLRPFLRDGQCACGVSHSPDDSIHGGWQGRVSPYQRSTSGGRAHDLGFSFLQVRIDPV